MFKTRVQQLLATFVVAALVLSSVATFASAAPAAQVRSQTVTGTIPGGDFTEYWMVLDVINPGTVTVRAAWDRTDLGGIGFYVLNDNNVAQVTSGSRARDNNIAAGSPVEAFRGGANEQEASFRATADAYTLIVYNESPADATFTLTADNAFVVEEAGNVSDPNAAEETPEATDEGGDAAAADEAAADEATPAAEADAAATPEPTEEAAADTTATTDETADTGDEAAADTTPASGATVSASGTVTADTLEGELPNKDDQHYLGLEPINKDGTVTLSLTFDPQDSTELARRLNFWVLDDRGFTQYLGGESLSKVAIAAGSSNVDTADNERAASFKAVGFGPYTVIVYNSSTVPATYTLSATGALLSDESGQTLTAQQSAVAAATDETATDEGETTGETATTTTTTTTTTGTTTTAGTSTGTTREGEPGGTYTIQSGDTLSIIARDIYGDVNLYQEICDFNQIENCDRVEVGDVIQLPTVEEMGTGATAPAASAATSPLPRPTATPAPVTASSDITATTAVTGTSAVTTTETMTDTADTMAADEEAGGTLVEVLTADGRFKNLLAALDIAGLSDALAAGGPYTVLAPTDAAFAALPDGALDALIAQLRSNPEGQLYDILRYHVARGELLSSDIENGLEVQTLQGNTVKFEVDADGNVTVNGAAISGPDILATDGVVHAIDAVILPPLSEE